MTNVLLANFISIVVSHFDEEQRFEIFKRADVMDHEETHFMHLTPEEAHNPSKTIGAWDPGADRGEND